MSVTYHLRKAEDKDIQLLFDWANDSLTRQNSFHSEPISWDEHEAWFLETIQNPKCQIYLYCNEDRPIGQVRIAISNEGYEAQVSYSIARAYRGLGHGKKMLSLLAERVKTDFPDVQKLVAEVKPENIASQRCFLDIGYKERYRMYEYELNVRQALQVSEIQAPGQNGGVLFLTNNANTLVLYDWLLNRIPACLWSDPIDVDLLKNVQPKLVVSFNYRYIINQDCIDFMKGQMVNLHISMLPWNRGSSPNFWSFIDNTPKGVTIHRVSAGLDEGDILLQKEVYMDPEQETFRTSYEKLIQTITDLFEQNFEDLLNGAIEPRKQGSYHTTAEFKALREQVPFSYDEKISDVIAKWGGAQAKGSEQ